MYILRSIQMMYKCFRSNTVWDDSTFLPSASLFSFSLWLCTFLFVQLPPFISLHKRQMYFIQIFILLLLPLFEEKAQNFPTIDTISTTIIPLLSFLFSFPWPFFSIRFAFFFWCGNTRKNHLFMQINSIIGNSNFLDKNINTPFSRYVKSRWV